MTDIDEEIDDANVEDIDKDEKYLKISVSLLFSDYVDRDPADNLRTIERYYRYLADKIDPKRLRINADQELLEAFESVSLLLRERLLLFPDTIRNQVSQIFEDEKLLQTFSILSNIPQDELKRIRFESPFLDIMSLFSSWIRKDSILSRNYGLTPRVLFSIKIGLKRISQVVKYASTINFLDYDTTFHEFKDHYDPNLISKNKVNTLINILKIQIENIPDRGIAERLEQKLEKLEEELKKPKPKWGAIIAGFFILFGFLADLKTINPSIYDRPYEIVNQIITTIHNDGLVQRNQALLQFTEKQNGKTGEMPKQLDPPKEAIPPRKEDEIN